MALPLPDLVLFSNFENNWDKYFDFLYSVYLTDLVNSGLTFRGLPIHFRFIPPTDNKGFGFWHIISEGENEDDRLPCFERCERIKWIRWMILESDTNSDILSFESNRGSSTNIVLWNKLIHYAVILSKRNNYYLLVTAFPTSTGRERSFLRDWKQFHGI